MKSTVVGLRPNSSLHTNAKALENSISQKNWLVIFSKRQALSRAVVVNSNMSRGEYPAREGPGSRLVLAFNTPHARPQKTVPQKFKIRTGSWLNIWKRWKIAFF